MRLRMRQICLVARDLDAAEADLSAIFLEHIRQPLDLPLVGLVRDEVEVEAQRDEAGGAAVPADDLDDIFAVEVARLAQERLLAIVVIRFVVLELPRNIAVRAHRVVAHLQGHVFRVGDRPACERPGALLHVLLGVVADTHRKEFEYFPPVVLVDTAPVVVLVVEKEDHCRVSGKLDEDVAKTPEAILAKHLDLGDHHFALDEFVLGGREDPVPEKSDLFHQRRVRSDHPAHPV